MSSNGYYWSQPLSTSPPTEKDLELNNSLHACLQANKFFESIEESQKREIVLGTLNQQVKEWVRRVTLKKTGNETLAAEAGGKIFTLGSYRLGVHQQGADIDTLVLGPKFVTREDFFSDLYEILCKRPEISKITKVPDAFTPIMNLVFSDIEIDLLFASLNHETSVPDSIDLSDPKILRTLDAKGVRSLNGPRVADDLLKLVPDIKVYRLALCAIKFWAQRRAVYSNILGFLGGIAWALLTARICQFYPNACAFTVVSRFFRVFKAWKWPQPVTLKPIEDLNIGELKVWDPKKNYHDGKHLMPVITPSYPSMNSTHNVSYSTLNAMMLEFTRGDAIMTEIENGTKTWDDLFEKSDFFSRFKHYIEIIVSADSEEAFHKWKGFAESRLRFLVQSLEQVQYVVASVPYPDNFVRREEIPSKDENSPPNTRHLCSFMIGITIDMTNAPKIPKPAINLSPAFQAFNGALESWDSWSEGMEVELKNLKKADLPPYIIPAGEVKKRKKAPEGGEKKVKRAKKDTDTGVESPSEKQAPNRSDFSSPSRDLLVSQNLVNSPGAEEITQRPQSPLPSAGIPLTSVSSSPSLVPLTKDQELEAPKLVTELVELDSTPALSVDATELKKADIKLKLVSSFFQNK